jgi:predicted DsbA family dithiol-disulfide isomerase
MSDRTINVVFYHSVACPRCQLSGHMLRRVLRAHPDVEVTWRRTCNTVSNGWRIDGTGPL